jgi:hypothetical protein
MRRAVINDPATLRAQLEAQYQQWSAGQFDSWLAGQPETFKWQSSYNGVPLKLKGKAGAQQYFATLNADLDVQSYKVRPGQAAVGPARRLGSHHSPRRWCTPLDSEPGS